MPRAPARGYLDEDVSVVVAAILKARGFDIVTARDAEQLGLSDSQQLAFATGAGRVLVTHNRVDFERVHREWLATERAHAGIVVARRRPPGELAARIGRLLSRLSAEDLKSQLLYM
jgi:hypothetical protein